MSCYGIPEPPLDPPDDPPLVECPDCVEGAIPDENGEPTAEPCPECHGAAERYLTDDEVRDAQAEAEIERAEARRDGDL